MAGLESDWRLIRKDQVTGVEEWWRWNGDGTCTVRTTQDVEPVLDRNHAEYTHNNGWDDEKLFRRAGRIPNVVLQDYRNKGINLLRPENEQELKRLLNNSDYAKLRTAHWLV